MDKKRWDIVIPIITILLLIVMIIVALVKDANERIAESVTTEATTETEIATASEATPAEAKEQPEPTKEVVHCITTESTTQAETTEEPTTEVFSATVEEVTTAAYTEEITTEEWTEEITEEPTTEYVEEVYEEPAPPEEPQEPEAPSEPEGMTYLGTYTITGYTWTGYPCANGNYPSVGYTAACNSLELGTVIYIEGIGTRVVEDRVGRSGKIVDVFVNSDSEAYSITGSYEVYIVE